MATQHTMTFKNATDLSLKFYVYKRFPGRNLDSVVWKVCSLPPQLQVSSPTSSDVHWTMNYGVAIADISSDEGLSGKYQCTQKVGGMLGSKYGVEIQGTAVGISPTPIGSTSSDEMILYNQTNPGEKVNMGFTLGGDLIGAERDVVGGAYSIFKAYPNDYYVAASNKEIELGDRVSQFYDSIPFTSFRDVPIFDFALPEVQVTINDVQVCTVEAFEENGRYLLKVLN